MLRTRVIPCLLLQDESLVKTVRFKNAKYVGDPANTLRIFNELEVDEIFILDISATLAKREPNFGLIRQFTDECFMPMGYGGGIRTVDHAKWLIQMGMEKVVVNSEALARPDFIRELSDHFGSQAIVVSMDVKKSLFGKYEVYSQSGRVNTKKTPVEWAAEAARLGAGEILLTSIDREGTWSGFDSKLVQSVVQSVDVPVIASGGAGSIAHIQEVIKKAGASAAALGSMVVYQGEGLGVLVNFPDQAELEKALHLT